MVPMFAELASVGYGLVSAACWGSGDFSGGVASKRTSVYAVVVLSQFIGGSLLLVLALCLAGASPGLANMAVGAVGGVSGGIGLLALYKGLAEGRMGVVAPLAAVVTALIPVLFGFLTEGLPGIVTIAGFALALPAVWLLASSRETGGLRMADLLLPFVAGSGFGCFFVLIGSVAAEEILWPLVSARMTSALVLTVVLLALKPASLKGPYAPHLPLILLAGLFDTGGNTFFALAARTGRLDIAAVVASLYPAATVLMARVVLKEKLTRRQMAGFTLALTALVLIAS